MLYKDAWENIRHWQERWRDPILTALLILMVLEVFVIIPLSASHSSYAPVLAKGEFLLMVSAVLVACRNRVAFTAVLISSMLTVIANNIRLGHPTTSTICVGSASSVVFMVALGWVVWGAVFGPGQVSLHRIQGAIVLYLSIALAFAGLYEVVVVLAPGAISPVSPQGHYLVLGPRLVYFSLVTLTSTGYGDVAPLHPMARSLASLEALIGQLFPATLLARIVTLVMEGRRR